MSDEMKVVVQHVKGHRTITLGRILESFPNATVVECHGDPMDTFRRCLVQWAHWHLEDDVILAPDFKERAAEVIERHGRKIIRGFGTGTHSGFMPASSYLWNQCTWMPEGVGPEIAAFLDGWKRIKEHPTGFDLVIRDWLVSRKLCYWLESPSLVQHAAFPSLLGARSRNRISPTFKDWYGPLVWWESTPPRHVGETVET